MGGLNVSNLSAKQAAAGNTVQDAAGTPLASVPDMMRQAQRAFDTWRRLAVAERLRYLTALRLELLEALDECVDVIAEDTGKPKTEAVTAEVLVVAEAIAYLERHAERILKTRKVKTPLTLIGKTSYIAHEPRGVMLVISPWNFPFMLAAVPALSALAAGNSVIIKPSEVTPKVGKWMEAWFQKAGFPVGTVQVAHGAGDLGAKLIEAHPDYIFFTGSTKTGKIIQEAAARQLIPTTLELGGKDPMIIFQDAHLERAAKGALWGALTNSGQVCVSAERIYVERPAYERFVALLKEQVRLLKQDDSDDADLGSMTFAPQIDIVKDHVHDAVSKGAVVAYGRFPDERKGETGLKLGPLILTDVTHDMKVMREETFGPVICVMPFDGEEEAVRLANDTRYGLSASVWTRDAKKARRIAAALACGSVVVNDTIVSIASPYLPFGGIKESGIGSYHGEAGLRAFTYPKAILVDRGRKKSEVNWFPYAGKYPLFLDLVQAYYGKRKQWRRFVRAYLRLLKKS
jgi:acyl-CoA reductase-like NAD-dependent aldehyde dehydrogenase